MKTIITSALVALILFQSSLFTTQAFGLLKDGVYTCSDDIQAEKELYERFTRIVQNGIDTIRGLHPEWTENQLRNYIDRNDFGQIMNRAKECIESHGYDTTTLPQVVVPEFGSTVMMITTVSVFGAILFYRKFF